MRRPPVRRFRAVNGLTVREQTLTSVCLRSRFATVEIAVLAADLFRLRVARGSCLAGQPSWAVVKTDWPPVRAEIRARARSVDLSTRSGRLTYNLAHGGWTVSGPGGRPIFRSPPGATGFEWLRPCVRLALEEGEGLFGLGETTGTFNKRGLIREFWNLDVLGHAPGIYPGLRSLYVSIPFALSLRAGWIGGLFWDNPARQCWDLGQTQLDRWQMTAATGEVDLYLFLGPTVAGVVRRYTELTGRIPLLPRWVLGYHQSRYGYESRAELEQVARAFRRKRIPCDTLYLDLHHLDGRRVFTFGRTFPRPAEMIAGLARRGFKVVSVVDPGVKDESRSGLLRRGRKIDAFVKAADGKTDCVERAWPGPCHFPDFLRARVREWWGQEQGRLSRLGVAGFWLDMNEPATFTGPGRTLPDDARHETDIGPRRHAEVHNVYGLQMARAAHEGARRAQSGQRPFILTRAGYAGIQRYAAVWTGDTSSTWEHLADAVQMLLNLGLSGVAFCGADVGGFLDNVTPELFVRWLQMAIFTPFLRNHTNLDTVAQEPWRFGPRVEKIGRRYLELRYQMLPCLEGLLAEAQQTGAPLMRPLFWHYQEDPIAAGTGDQFLLGRDLLVAPVLRQGAVARSVYLPGGVWHDFWTGDRHPGGRHVIAAAPLDVIPVFVRAGAILPMAPVQQFVGQVRTRVLNLHVWAGGEGRLAWQEDDGQAPELDLTNSSRRGISSFTTDRFGRLTIEPTIGRFPSSVEAWRLIVRGVRRPRRVEINRRRVGHRYDERSELLACEVANRADAIEVRWR